jgi:hypothetical protein
MIILALVIASLAICGALYAIFKSLSFATNSTKMKGSGLPEGTYRLHKVGREGFDDVFELELIETKEGK